jgi:hypothetical protein
MTTALGGVRLPQIAQGRLAPSADSGAALNGPLAYDVPRGLPPP